MPRIDTAGPANTVYLGLGSNLGDRRAQLRAALQELIQGRISIIAVSSLYETQPVGFADQGLFLNAVVKANTWLEPRQLLDLAKSIERRLGRKPRFRNGPREVDIDLLVYDYLRLREPGLELPHPRMAERAFVQIPLAEVDGRPLAPSSAVRLVEPPSWASF